MRVPTPNVSVVDLVVTLKKDVTAESVNKAIKDAAESGLKGYLQYSEKPLVSIDFCGNKVSSIVDADLTMIVGERMVKVLAWYDNEWGYSNRLVELATLVAKKLPVAAK
jgi:glyceraldehyde 3-phosphate dehydrogenase